MKIKALCVWQIVLALVSVLFGSNNLLAQNGNCDFPDCPSGENCGNNPDYSEELYEAVQYLCANGIVEGIDGDLKPDDYITRDQLAKITLYGLYGGINNVPPALVTDSFPSIYPDLQNPRTYYYRSAKALLYLEYGDGISPFDRDRAFFDPEAPIERSYVLKVMLEAFNVPLVEGFENPFADFEPDDENYGKFWVYACEAFRKGVVQTEVFRPGDLCTRGEAFLFLYRLMTSELITIPVPANTNDFETSDFFIPINLRPKVLNEARGIEQGNFSYYNRKFFDIPGYMPLEFGVSYDSYLTEVPKGYMPEEPMGSAWTHTYNMYINLVCNVENNRRMYVVHMGDGSLLMYEEDGDSFESITEGNYNELSRVNNQLWLKTPMHDIYFFDLLQGQLTNNYSVYYMIHHIDGYSASNRVDITYEPQSIFSYRARVQSVSALGRTLVFSYNDNNLLQSVTDPIGRQVFFSYDENKLLSSIKDAKNYVTGFQYGTNDSDKGLLTCIELPKGNKVFNEYQQRKLTSTRYNDNNPTTVDLSLDYTNGNSSSTVIAPVTESQNYAKTYGFNEDNRISHIQNYDPTTYVIDKDIYFNYDNSSDNSLITSIVDNIMNIQTNYSYNNAGAVATMEVLMPESVITFGYEYNDIGDPISMTDFNGNTTHFYYCSGGALFPGKVNQIVDALGQSTTITYNDRCAVETITDPMGKVTQYDYNQYGNVTQVTINPLGISTSTEYDLVSRVEAITDFNGKTRSFEYDNNDNRTKETDELGLSSTYLYDPNNNLIRINNARGFSTFLDYDSEDQLEAVSFQGSTISMTYNPDGSLKSYMSPNGDQFNYIYDGAGKLLNDGYASYSYYENGLLEHVSKDGKSIDYTYTTFGQRISSVNYDGNTVLYTYDLNGNVETITYPGDKIVTYEYDALNRVTAVKDWNNAITSFVYRADNQIDHFTYPNGVRTNFSYDNIGRRNGISTSRSNGQGTVIASESYSLDNMGNHTNETVVHPYGLLPEMASGAQVYSYNTANRLLTFGDISYEYDANGNTTSRTGRNYIYDTKDKLIEVSGDFSAVYSYDGLGYRRSAMRNGVTTNYVIDILTGDGNVLAETDDGGNPRYYYIYGPTGLISRINANNETEYYVYDFRGSTLAMTDSSEEAIITHKYQYDDFGKVLQMEETDENLFRFVGRYGVMYESEDLVFMRDRYYDAEIGRFLSEDPIWNPNMYAYANNNPVNNIDPNGNMSFSAVGYLSSGLALNGYLINMYLTGQPFNYGDSWATRVQMVLDIYGFATTVIGIAASYIPALHGVAAAVGATLPAGVTLGAILGKTTVSAAFSAAGVMPVLGLCISALCIGLYIGNQLYYLEEEIKNYNGNNVIRSSDLQGRGANMPLQHSVSKSEWEDLFIPRCGY
jgi:RHS repeat-associated protein